MYFLLANNKTNKSPSQKELKELVTSKVAHKWFPIGIGRGMSGDNLKKYKKIPMIFLTIALVNSSMNGNRTLTKTNHLLGTWDTLLKVLRSFKIGKESLAKNLER